MWILCLFGFVVDLLFEFSFGLAWSVWVTCWFGCLIGQHLCFSGLVVVWWLALSFVCLLLVVDCR